MILLRKKCKPVEIIIQAVLALVYGYMTDFSCKLIDSIQVNTYFAQFLWMALGLLRFGTRNLDSVQRRRCHSPGRSNEPRHKQVSGKRYENIKILFDVLYIVAAAVIGFIATGKLQGVREGSIIAAVVVGNIIKLYNLIFNKLTKKSAKKKTDANRSSAAKLSPANDNLSLQSK